MTETFSLLPYLDRRHSPFFLNLLPWSESGEPGHSSGTPFRVVDQSPPCCTLSCAELLSDALTPVRNLFLVKQKDAYSSPELLKTNLDIDASWRSALDRVDSGLLPDTPIRITAQRDDTGALKQCSPLFFCRQQDIFFHPPCPECGQPLELCTRDEVLEQFGLPQYSTTLERFLFCPQCFSQGSEPVFYTFAPNRYHPPCVKNHHALIAGFGNIKDPPSPELGFPCLGCPSQHSCFTPDPLSAPPIVPFGFYPFFLLIFEAPTLRADDFLALLSNADPGNIVKAHKRQGNLAGADLAEKVIAGLHGQLFLTPEGPNRLLEVLYLKMTFLLEVFEHFFVRTQPASSLKSFESPQTGSFWIQLQKKSRGLPLFWDFKVHTYNIGPPVQARLPASLSLAHRVNAFGLMCFFALQADQAAVPDRLETAFQTPEADLNRDSLFPLKTLFRNADKILPPSTALEAWQSSLNIGWDCLTWNQTRNTDAFLDSQRQRMESLLDDLRQALFAGPGESAVQDKPAQSESLLSVMDEIIASWSSQQTRDRPAPQAENKGQEEETLFFTPESGQSSEEETMNIDETRVETVFLSLDDHASPLNPDSLVQQPPQQRPDSGEDLEATVFVHQGQPPEPEQPPAQEGGEATVVLGRHQGPMERQPETGPDASPSDPEEQEEDLDKTVILNTRSRKGGGHGRGQGR